MSFEVLKRHTCFSGETLFCEHSSLSTKTKMKFSMHLPQDIEKIENAIVWLSGLTCTDENFITKAGAQKFLVNSKTLIICPDTSPRGIGAPGEDESYDFGTGAGFYVNATTEGYRENYQMYDYIMQDIVDLLKRDLEIKNISIMGHSMGGHGALVLGLRNPSIFQSISAFSPIVNPMNCPWGKKAFKGYLGESEKEWENYDACKLIENGNLHKNKILVEQGLADEFFKEQLLTQNLEEVCDKKKQLLQVNYRKQYDHSYYFISSFIEEHINFHLEVLESAV